MIYKDKASYDSTPPCNVWYGTFLCGINARVVMSVVYCHCKVYHVPRVCLQYHVLIRLVYDQDNPLFVYSLFVPLFVIHCCVSSLFVCVFTNPLFVYYQENPLSLFKFIASASCSLRSPATVRNISLWTFLYWMNPCIRSPTCISIASTSFSSSTPTVALLQKISPKWIYKVSGPYIRYCRWPLQWGAYLNAPFCTSLVLRWY